MDEPIGRSALTLVTYKSLRYRYVNARWQYSVNLKSKNVF